MPLRTPRITTEEHAANLKMRGAGPATITSNRSAIVQCSQILHEERVPGVLDELFDIEDSSRVSRSMARLCRLPSPVESLHLRMTTDSMGGFLPQGSTCQLMRVLRHLLVAGKFQYGLPIAMSVHSRK
jgi:hypothetical protein